jgi:hypothetical protein
MQELLTLESGGLFGGSTVGEVGAVVAVAVVSAVVFGGAGVFGVGTVMLGVWGTAGVLGPAANAFTAVNRRIAVHAVSSGSNINLKIRVTWSTPVERWSRANAR